MTVAPVDVHHEATPRKSRVVRRTVAWLCAALCLSGVTLHVTVGDVSPFPWNVVYYALPRPVLCGLALVAAVLARFPDGRLRCAAWTAVGALAAWVLACDVGWNARETGLTTEPSQRIVFWNVASFPRGWDATCREIQALDADVVGLVEWGSRRQAGTIDFKARFPEYTIDAQPEHALLVRGRILERGHVPLDNHSHARWWDVELAGRTVRIVVVDISSSLFQSRQPALARLRTLLESGGDRPIVMLGDFNIPVDAPSLRTLRAAGLRAATTENGRGYRCTWPTPLPVLTLDQIWTNSQVTVHSASAGWSWNSDHRPVSAVVTIGTTPSSETSGAASR